MADAPTEDVVTAEEGDEEEEDEEGGGGMEEEDGKEEEVTQESTEEQESNLTDFDALPTEVKTVNMTELKTMLDDAIESLEVATASELIQTLASPTDIHQQAVASAKQIGQEFVESATDLADTMRLILSFDQLLLKKLKQSTAFDYGIKPKTEEGKFIGILKMLPNLHIHLKKIKN